MQGNIFNIINIIILSINVIILGVQCVLNHRSIKQTKMLSDSSQQKTEMLSKISRFLEYDNLLNGILYEFYVSRNEILGLEKHTKKIEDVIDQEQEGSLKVTLEILNYKSFLAKFKLSTTFVKLQENGYIFFIKEDFNNTIWEKIWSSCDLLKLHSQLGFLLNEIKDLDDVVRNEMGEIEKIIQKKDQCEEFPNEISLKNIKRCINKINGKISKYKKQFKKCVNILPDNCETYKIIKDLNNNS